MRVGQWFSRSGVSERNLGLAKGNTKFSGFELNKDIEELALKATPINDTWERQRSLVLLVASHWLMKWWWRRREPANQTQTNSRAGLCFQLCDFVHRPLGRFVRSLRFFYCHFGMQSRTGAFSHESERKMPSDCLAFKAFTFSNVRS